MGTSLPPARAWTGTATPPRTAPPSSSSGSTACTRYIGRKRSLGAGEYKWATDVYTYPITSTGRQPTTDPAAVPVGVRVHGGAAPFPRALPPQRMVRRLPPRLGARTVRCGLTSPESDWPGSPSTFMHNLTPLFRHEACVRERTVSIWAVVNANRKRYITPQNVIRGRSDDTTTNPQTHPLMLTAFSTRALPPPTRVPTATTSAGARARVAAAVAGRPPRPRPCS